MTVLGGAADGEGDRGNEPNKAKAKRDSLARFNSDFLLMTTMAAPSSDGIGIANLPNQVRSVLCIYVCLEGLADENYLPLAT